MARVIVGVCGGIAAYKTPLVVRALMRHGHEVSVIPTPASTSFVGAATWEALTGRRVATGVFDHPWQVEHVEVTRTADLIAVIPATANTLAGMRAGLADNLLLSTILSADAPVIAFPAMHTNMWTNPATRDNVQALRARGVDVVDPVDGDLSSGDRGIGRMPDPDDIVDHLLARLSPGLLSGRRVVISAGGTREPLDPVRFLGNRSSGRMGCALARAARDLGASVVLVHANVEAGLLPRGVELVSAPCAEQMAQAMRKHRQGADLVVMAAAVADYRPRHRAQTKIKKEGAQARCLVVELEPTTDILAELSTSREADELIVGFAAETGDHRSFLDLGKEKARRKGADLVAINKVGNSEGFGDVDTQVFLVDQQGTLLGDFSGTKDAVASALMTTLADRLSARV